MARPIELDDLKAQRICAAIAAGNTRRCAAQAAGIGFTTLKQWAARGRTGEEPFAAFWARLQKADADAEQQMVGVITTAAVESWQAAAWWLERRRRRSYRPPVRTVEQPQDTDYSQVPLEQLEATLATAVELRKKAANG